jgi:hypothetical protein
MPMRNERPLPTPRAQVARVLVGATAAVLLGAGPAIAWDLSTQPPRAVARPIWPRPSPWLSAGKQMKTAAGGLARVYLPRSSDAPAESTEVTAPPPPGAGAPAPARSVAPAAALSPYLE